MSSFMRGLSEGSQTARGWLDTYKEANEAARERKAAEEISAYRDGLGKVPEGQPSPLQGLDLGGVGSLLTPPTQDAPPAASGAPLRAPTTGLVPRGTPLDDFAASMPKMPARSAQAMAESSIYNRYGLVDRAEQARNLGIQEGRYEEQSALQQSERKEDMAYRAQVDTRAANQRNFDNNRQVRLDELNAEEREQRMQSMGLNISEQERAIDVRKATEAAQSTVAGYIADGSMSMERIAELVSADSNVNGNALLETYSKQMGVTKQAAEAEVARIVKELNVAGRSLEELNKWLKDSNFDPVKGDNIYPEVRKLEDGTWGIFYGDEPLNGYSETFGDEGGLEGYKNLVGSLVSVMEGNPLAWKTQVAELEYKRAATQRLHQQSYNELIAATAGKAPTLENINSMARLLQDRDRTWERLPIGAAMDAAERAYAGESPTPDQYDANTGLRNNYEGWDTVAKEGTGTGKGTGLSVDQQEEISPIPDAGGGGGGTPVGITRAVDNPYNAIATQGLVERLAKKLNPPAPTTARGARTIDYLRQEQFREIAETVKTMERLAANPWLKSNYPEEYTQIIQLLNQHRAQ